MIRAVENGPDAGSARHCTPKHQCNLDRQSDAFKAVMGRRPASRRTCPSIGQQVFRITSGGEDRNVDWERVVPARRTVAQRSHAFIKVADIPADTGAVVRHDAGI